MSAVKAMSTAFSPSTKCPDFITQENNEWNHGRNADVGSDDYNRFVQSKKYREKNCSDQLKTPDRNDAHEHTKCDRDCFEFIALVPTVNMLIKKRLHFFSVEQSADKISWFDIQKRDDHQKCIEYRDAREILKGPEMRDAFSASATHRYSQN